MPTRNKILTIIKMSHDKCKSQEFFKFVCDEDIENMSKKWKNFSRITHPDKLIGKPEDEVAKLTEKFTDVTKCYTDAKNDAQRFSTDVTKLTYNWQQKCKPVDFEPTAEYLLTSSTQPKMQTKGKRDRVPTMPSSASPKSEKMPGQTQQAPLKRGRRSMIRIMSGLNVLVEHKGTLIKEKDVNTFVIGTLEEGKDSAPGGIPTVIERRDTNFTFYKAVLLPNTKSITFNPNDGNAPIPLGGFHARVEKLSSGIRMFNYLKNDIYYYVKNQQTNKYDILQLLKAKSNVSFDGFTEIGFLFSNDQQVSFTFEPAKYKILLGDEEEIPILNMRTYYIGRINDVGEKEHESETEYFYFNQDADPKRLVLINTIANKPRIRELIEGQFGNVINYPLSREQLSIEYNRSNQILLIRSSQIHDVPVTIIVTGIHTQTRQPLNHVYKINSQVRVDLRYAEIKTNLVGQMNVSIKFDLLEEQYKSIQIVPV